MARVLQPVLADILGVSVIVENRPGGGGVSGMIALADADPDGHTLILTAQGPATTIPNITDVGYTYVDFAPISGISGAPIGAWARPDQGIYTLQEMVDFALANPGTTFSSGSAGGDGHFAAEMFFASIGHPGLMVQVPYASGAEGFASFVAGHIDFAFDDAIDGVPWALQDLAIQLAIMHPEGCVYLPETPTFIELGHDIVYITWWATAAPAGTPDYILDFYDAIFAQVLSDPEVYDTLHRLMIPAMYLDRADATERWINDWYNNRALAIEIGLSEFDE
ncbi:MAG: tripartite tricarboxylate transporter substrate binding protein [Defluviitaleaceae bacterium]|nr:tripartite tricarboxylate transporter substrate binding protein [Defluviitaleaceae bacterium]